MKPFAPKTKGGQTLGEVRAPAMSDPEAIEADLATPGFAEAYAWAAANARAQLLRLSEEGDGGWAGLVSLRQSLAHLPEIVLERPDQLIGLGAPYLGDSPLDYPDVPDFREDLRDSVRAAREALGTDAPPLPPAELGAAGWSSAAGPIGHDELRDLGALARLRDAGGLDRLRTAERPVAVELGCRRGGLAQKLKTLVPRLRHVFLVPPEACVAAATYLRVLLPHAQIAFVWGLEQPAPDADIVFCPTLDAPTLLPARIDLVIDTEALASLNGWRLDRLALDLSGRGTPELLYCYAQQLEFAHNHPQHAWSTAFDLTIAKPFAEVRELRVGHGTRRHGSPPTPPQEILARLARLSDQASPELKTFAAKRLEARAILMRRELHDLDLGARVGLAGERLLNTVAQSQRPVRRRLSRLADAVPEEEFCRYPGVRSEEPQLSRLGNEATEVLALIKSHGLMSQKPGRDRGQDKRAIFCEIGPTYGLLSYHVHQRYAEAQCIIVDYPEFLTLSLQFFRLHAPTLRVDVAGANTAVSGETDVLLVPLGETGSFRMPQIDVAASAVGDNAECTEFAEQIVRFLVESNCGVAVLPRSANAKATNLWQHAAARHFHCITRPSVVVDDQLWAHSKEPAGVRALSTPTMRGHYNLWIRRFEALA